MREERLGAPVRRYQTTSGDGKREAGRRQKTRGTQQDGSSEERRRQRRTATVVRAVYISWRGRQVRIPMVFDVTRFRLKLWPPVTPPCTPPSVDNWKLADVAEARWNGNTWNASGPIFERFASQRYEQTFQALNRGHRCKQIQARFKAVPYQTSNKSQTYFHSQEQDAR